jgi:hypothetical protein
LFVFKKNNSRKESKLSCSDKESMPKTKPHAHTWITKTKIVLTAIPSKPERAGPLPARVNPEHPPLHQLAILSIQWAAFFHLPPHPVLTNITTVNLFGCWHWIFFFFNFFWGGAFLIPTWPYYLPT